MRRIRMSVLQAKPRQLRQRGFTLIEVMIVVAIVAVLFAVALPSYQQHVRKTKRTDAMAALTGFAQHMERHFVQNSTYVTAITGAAPQAPDIFQTQVPLEGGTATYNLLVQEVTATSFTLRATPVGAQVGDGYLELLSTGLKRWNENDSAVKNCWDSSC